MTSARLPYFSSFDASGPPAIRIVHRFSRKTAAIDQLSFDCLQRREILASHAKEIACYRCPSFLPLPPRPLFQAFCPLPTQPIVLSCVSLESSLPQIASPPPKRRVPPQPAGVAAGRAADAGQDHQARGPALRRDAPIRLRLLEGPRPQTRSRPSDGCLRCIVWRIVQLRFETLGCMLYKVWHFFLRRLGDCSKHG
jgi:hypothetical protein